jgi:predicted DNA-binding transcriptional regulator YafY
MFTVSTVSTGFRLSSHTFEYPKDFDPKEYFAGCYGVIADDGTKIEHVVLKVSAGQANYLRDLPMYDNQKEERHDEYSILRLDVRPTFDFQQEILWNGEDLEVLEPYWLRKEMAGKIKRMWNKYKDDDK